MLNKFHPQYKAVVLESNDWHFPSTQDLEVAWQSPSHSLNCMVSRTTLHVGLSVGGAPKGRICFKFQSLFCIKRENTGPKMQ